MPFGLKIAPATFQRTLDILLAGYRWKSCLVYLDDVIILLKTVEEHFGHVEEILEILRSAGVTLKLAKCDVLARTVKCLGHIIKPGRLQVDHAVTVALTGMQHPKT